MSTVGKDWFSGNTLASDLFDLSVGEYLGGGVARKVYVYRPNTDLVIKFEDASCSFQNVQEWHFWNNMKNCPDAAKWLAPCVTISACGTILLQHRTAPLRRREMAKYKKLPKFLTDVKMDNFGMLNGKLVAHDYGLLRWSYDIGMRKADWGL